MKFGNALMALLMAASVLSCNPKADEGTKHYAPLKNPTKVTLEQVEFSAIVNVTWQDNCDNESGYAIYVKPANGEEQQLASLPADACEYSIKEGLVQGKSYSIGVRALSDGPMLSSQIIYKEIALFDYTSLPVPTLLLRRCSTTLSANPKNTIRALGDYAGAQIILLHWRIRSHTDLRILR